MASALIKSFAILCLFTGAGALQARALPPDQGLASCDDVSMRPAVRVTISGFKNRSGTVRVQVYGPGPAGFLVKGKWLKRIEVPTASAVGSAICVALPGLGHYAVAVRHDADRNGKSGWDDGGGFSRNPRISLLRLKPQFDQVAIAVGREVVDVAVVMNYRRGLSIGPIR